MSIQCIKRPPNNAPNGLVSLGRTISFISEYDSRTGRGARVCVMRFLFGVADRTGYNSRLAFGSLDQGVRSATAFVLHQIPVVYVRWEDVWILLHRKSAGAGRGRW